MSAIFHFELVVPVVVLPHAAIATATTTIAATRGKLLPTIETLLTLAIAVLMRGYL